MKHQLPFKSLLIIFTAVFFLQSCSTGYEASRFSHLKYVKKNHVSSPDDAMVFEKEEIQPLKGTKTPPVLEAPDNDYAASLDKIPSTKSKKQDANTKIYQSPVPESYSHNKKSQSSASRIDQFKSFLKDDTFTSFKKAPDSSLMYDQQKLLILWIALMSAALVFLIVAPYAQPLYIFSAIAFAAGLVFFIFWLVAIANA